MKTLVILYMIYLSWGTAGQGRLSILELSRYLRRSKSQMRNDILYLAKEGLLEITRLYSDAGSEKLMVQLSAAGGNFLMERFDAAMLEYQKHVAETIEIINMRTRVGASHPQKLSRKQIEAINAGQKGLFE